MIKIVKNILIIIFICSPSFLNASEKIAYIDLQLIMNQSNVGISIRKEINKLNSDLKKEILDLETGLKKKDKELMAKKNILEKKEFDLLVSKLRIDIKKFNDLKKKKILDIKNKKIAYDIKLVNSIKPILTNFSKSNNISLLFQKKNIILGAVELDITKDILAIVNKDIKTLDLK